MYFVSLSFRSDDRSQARASMSAHQAWIQQGFDDGVFLVVGSLAGGAGGAVVASGCTREALERRVAADPFVALGIVAAEIVEVAVGRTDPRLGFLLA